MSLSPDLDYSRVLCCGDRDWLFTAPIDALIRQLVPIDSVIIHGAARGADSLAGLAATRHQLRSLVFPARWDALGRSAGPVRNQQMLDEGRPTVVYAFHNDLPNSLGTRDMVRRSLAAGIPVKVVTHIAGVTSVTSSDL